MSNKSFFSLKGKNIVVTGASGLIGRSICEVLKANGAKVIAIDIIKSKIDSLEKIDVTKLDEIDSQINTLFKKYGKIHGLINNAYPRTKDWGNKVEDLNVKSWKTNIDMQLNSYSWWSRSMALKMKSKKIKGTIINIASIYGLVGPDFNVYKDLKMTCPMAYSVIKGGVVNLTRYMASYFGPSKIRFNCVCPGGVFNNQDKNFVKEYSNRVPLRRMCEPEDVANACAYLTSDAAEYLTGVILPVDGGWTAI